MKTADNRANANVATIENAALMQQIADWLGQLGLPGYADRVAESGIDFSLLPDVTEQDLKVCCSAIAERFCGQSPGSEVQRRPRRCPGDRGDHFRTALTGNGSPVSAAQHLSQARC
jgi:hypothetical protein